MRKLLWSAVATVATTAAAWAARRIATAIWTRLNDTEATPNPDNEGVTWPAALSWAGLAGLASGVARVFARKGTASVRGATTA